MYSPLVDLNCLVVLREYYDDSKHMKNLLLVEFIKVVTRIYVLTGQEFVKISKIQSKRKNYDL